MGLIRRTLFSMLWLWLPMAALAQSPADHRLENALRLAREQDWPAARALAEDASRSAGSPEERWAAREALASIAHLQGEDAEASNLLQAVLVDGIALFGVDSPRLIQSLRMLGISEAALGHDTIALQAQIRAVVLARGSGGEDFATQLLTMADLARSCLDMGHLAATSLLAAEAEIVATDDRGDTPAAQEAHLLRALAHLRMGHFVEAVVHALPVYRLDPAALTDEGNELLALFDTELLAGAASEGDAAALQDQWLSQALSREADRDAQTQAMNAALLPMMTALQAGDILAADTAARLALQDVLADDPIIINAYFALLIGTLAAERPDLAVAWADRLAAIDPIYLASLGLDPGQPLADVINWLLDAGRPVEALPLVDSMVGLARLRDGATSNAVMRGLSLQGAAFRRAGRWAEAEATLRSALALASDVKGNGPAWAVAVGGQTQDRARLTVQTQVELGLLAEDQGQMQAAEAAYTDALTTLQTTDAGKEKAGWAFVLSQLGAVYTTSGRLDAAEGLLQQALDFDLAQGGHNTRAAALSFYELARVQIYGEKLDQAQVTADQALASGLASMKPGDPELANIYLMQAGLLDRRGKPDQARAMLAQALAGTGASLAGRASLLMQEAVLRSNDGAAAEAMALMKRALDDVPPEDPLFAHLQAAAGAIALISGDLPGALTFFRPATADLTRYERRSEQSARDHLPLHVETARRLSEAATGEDATRLMAEAFAVAQRVNDISAGQALDKAAARLQGGSDALNNLARDLETRQRDSALARTTLLNRLQLGGTGTAERLALDAAMKAETSAQAAIARDFPRYTAFANPKPQDMLATMALLGPDEVLVIYATSDMTGFDSGDASTVIAITSDGYVAAGLPPRTELADLARALRCNAALTDRACGTAGGQTRGAFSLDQVLTSDTDPAFDFALAHSTYETLLAPVAEALRGKSTLIVVPDKALAALPFHLLLTAAPDVDTTLRNAPWLIRRMAVMISPTVAALASQRGAGATPGKAGKPFLGIGDPLIGTERAGAASYDCANLPEAGLYAANIVPDTGAILRDGSDLADVASLESLPALPETRCELLATARLLGTPDAVLLQDQATERHLKDLSARGVLMDYRILSFATHGLIAGEIGANNAGLVLTPPQQPDAMDDGLLTTAEIANLRLDADFVLLSACNTAAGATTKDEGLSGLASAFFLAGARSLLVSHWPVYSDAAARLTTNTFDAIAANPGIGRAEALRRAMLAILDDPAATPDMLHPAWWGPFMIAGEGGAGR